MSICRTHPYQSVSKHTNGNAKQGDDQVFNASNSKVGPRLKSLRLRSGLSIRQLAEVSNVTPAMISCIERSKTSPSILTMQKILSAMGTDFPSFFSTEERLTEGPVYHREKMHSISDESRSYTFIFPKSPEINVEVLDETINPSREMPPMEPLKCDIAGYILSGTLVLEIEGENQKTLRPGDAFYIKKGSSHRGYAGNGEPVRLINVHTPVKY